MEEYVDKKEFDALKNKVEEIENKTDKHTDLLHEIDKKVDLIIQNVENIKETEELKIQPLEDRVKKLEESKTWLWRFLGGTIIGLAIETIFSINK